MLELRCKVQKISQLLISPSSFSGCCAAILCCLGMLLGRVAAANRLSRQFGETRRYALVARRTHRCTARNHQRSREPPAGGQRAGERYLGRPQTIIAKGAASDMARAGRRWRKRCISTFSELAQTRCRPSAYARSSIWPVRLTRTGRMDRQTAPAGINLRDESRRFYPPDTWRLTCWGLPISIIRGIEGSEKSFNAQLTGQAGRRLVRKDRHGNVVEKYHRSSARGPGP